eukprot:14212682-Alexandrium_andersonii.AAC.1
MAFGQHSTGSEGPIEVSSEHTPAPSGVPSGPSQGSSGSGRSGEVWQGPPTPSTSSSAPTREWETLQQLSDAQLA